MAAYFDRTKKGLVGFHIDNNCICNLIDFDFENLPPQVFVAIEAAYREGVVLGEQRKSAQILAACGVVSRRGK